MQEWKWSFQVTKSMHKERTGFMQTDIKAASVSVCGVQTKIPKNKSGGKTPSVLVGKKGAKVESLNR